MGKNVWWGTLAVTAVGALALTLVVNGGNKGVAPQIPQDQAENSQHPAAAQTLVATSAEPAPATTAVHASVGDTKATVDRGYQPQSLTASPEMLQRARALRAADRAASRVQGPAEACLVQMKTVFCPIIGNMPFFRDVAGQVAMWGHFDCPTGTPPKS